MKIFVISLKSSKRRDFVKDQFEKLNLSFEFFDAIYGKELTDNEIDKLCSKEALKKSPQWLNKSAIGCALSHYYIYKKICDENIERCLIMEDDMILNNDFLKILDYLGNKKIDEEIILLYYRAFNEVKFSTANREVINTDFNILKPYTIKDAPITTGCYYISQQAAKKLANIILPIRVAADSWEYFMQNSDFKNLKVVFPRPIYDAGFKSDIDYNEAYSNKFVNKIKNFIDSLNIKFVNKLLVKRRKKLEKQMSLFALTEKESTI